MNEADGTHDAWARRLLAHEARAGAGAVAAATRVYEKIDAHITPLLGADGVRMLLARSAKLAQPDHPSLAGVSFSAGRAGFEQGLRAAPPDDADAAAVALFGAFFALLTTFIGERLTLQLLRTAWPDVVVTRAETTSGDPT